ncbi:nuclear transport factor 2 family protein [Flavihumibacter sp. R14]|nr:nuclear transport factor 2 family protein [Flavihumibacter soli]
MEKDETIIRESRAASNDAIARHDADGVARFWMKDILVISGEGGQYVGRARLLSVFKKMFSASPSIFERNPSEVIIGESGILAWESGSWHYKGESLRGNYSAMWRKINGRWLIQSELFVSLD